MALLLMHAAFTAYACPAFLSDLALAGDATPRAAQADDAMSGGCTDHETGNTAERNICHQHYAGEQSIGVPTLASTGSPVALPLPFVSLVEPVIDTPHAALAVLLQRSTAPPISIRFLVLRI